MNMCLRYYIDSSGKKIEQAAEARSDELFWANFYLLEEGDKIGCPLNVQATGRQLLDNEGVFRNTLKHVAVIMDTNNMRLLLFDDPTTIPQAKLVLDGTEFCAGLVLDYMEPAILDINGDKNTVILSAENVKRIVFEQNGAGEDYIAVLKNEDGKPE